MKVHWTFWWTSADFMIRNKRWNFFFSESEGEEGKDMESSIHELNKKAETRSEVSSINVSLDFITYLGGRSFSLHNFWSFLFLYRPFWSPYPPSPSAPFSAITHYFWANSNANSSSFMRLMFWLITYCADSTWNYSLSVREENLLPLCES